MNQTDKSIFLSGETIQLRALQASDIEGNYARWLNDPDITLYNSHGRYPVTVPELLQFVENALNSRSSLVMAIINIETGKHIGNISLQGISWIDRSAEIAFLLGEKAFWGKGVMYEAGMLIMTHGFKQLNLHRIHCGTSAENTGMQKLAEKLGMKQEGIRREALYKDGSYRDVIEYGILEHEFLKK